MLENNNYRMNSIIPYKVELKVQVKFI